MRKIDGIYRTSGILRESTRYSPRAMMVSYNYWGKIPDKTNDSPRLQLPDYYYSEFKEKK